MLKVAVMLAVGVGAVGAFFKLPCFGKSDGEDCITEGGQEGICTFINTFVVGILENLGLEPSVLELLLSKLPKKCVEIPTTTPTPTPQCSGVIFFVANSKTTFPAVVAENETSVVTCNDGFTPDFKYTCIFSGFRADVNCDPIPTSSSTTTAPAKRQVNNVEQAPNLLAHLQTRDTNTVACNNAPVPTVENGVIDFGSFAINGEQVAVVCNATFELSIQATCGQNGFIFTPLCLPITK